MDDSAKKNIRIAALLFRRIGDSLLATPALRAVKKYLPDAAVVVVCERPVSRVFAHNPSIDEITEINPAVSLWEFVSAVRRIQPTITLDFLSDPRSGLASLFSGAHRRIGIAGRSRGWMYTDIVARQNADSPAYSALHKLALAAAIGATECDTFTEFYLTDDDRAYAASAWRERSWDDTARVAAFFVHSRREYKRWPLEKFSNVVQLLRNQHSLQPLLLVTPGDEHAAVEMQKNTKLSVQETISISDLGHLAAVLERCSILISNDGGPKHIAVAVGTPTVTVFMQDSPLFWTPPGEHRHVAVSASAAPIDVYDAAVSIMNAASHGT
jgi:ADP-heptose:LPS heptosyltransferase